MYRACFSVWGTAMLTKLLVLLMYLFIRNVLCECNCFLAPRSERLNKTLKP